MNAKLKKCSCIIHPMALAHAASSFLLWRFGFSDEIVLSLLTISTIVLVCYAYGLPLEVSAAIAALCCHKSTLRKHRERILQITTISK